MKSEHVRCHNYCEGPVDLTNIRRAIKHAGCSSEINLKGLNSAVHTVRSLTCKCDALGSYVPRRNPCVQLYNCDIIIQLIDVGLPQIINGLGRQIKRFTCEALQILVDNTANVYQDCIGGALSFQGDVTQVSWIVKSRKILF